MTPAAQVRGAMKIGSPQWARVIVEGARDFGLKLNSRHTEMFAAHARELIFWTRVTNLTTITDPFEIAVKHFVDSLAPAAFIPPDTAFLLDIGSGGGFPGIVLKIVRPSLKVTLIDASRKKVSFLKHVIRKLSLEGVEALHARAEELADDYHYRHRFNAVVSRALASLELFVSLADPLVAENGLMVAMKGRMDPEQLVALQDGALKKSDVRSLVVSHKDYDLPVFNLQRSLVKLRVQS